MANFQPFNNMDLKNSQENFKKLDQHWQQKSAELSEAGLQTFQKILNTQIMALQQRMANLGPHHPEHANAKALLKDMQDLRSATSLQGKLPNAPNEAPQAQAPKPMSAFEEKFPQAPTEEPKFTSEQMSRRVLEQSKLKGEIKKLMSEYKDIKEMNVNLSIKNRLTQVDRQKLVNRLENLDNKITGLQMNPKIAQENATHQLLQNFKNLVQKNQENLKATLNIKLADENKPKPMSPPPPRFRRG